MKTGSGNTWKQGTETNPSLGKEHNHPNKIRHTLAWVKNTLYVNLCSQNQGDWHALE